MNKKDIPLEERKVTTIGFPDVLQLPKETQNVLLKDLLRIVADAYNKDCKKEKLTSEATINCVK